MPKEPYRKEKKKKNISAVADQRWRDRSLQKRNNKDHLRNLPSDSESTTNKRPLLCPHPAVL
jgi:hypothetical protein